MYTSERGGREDLGIRHDFSLAHEAVVSAFVECLTKGSAPPVTGEDGLKDLEMMLGAYLSIRTGKSVEFQLAAEVESICDM